MKYQTATGEIVDAFRLGESIQLNILYPSIRTMAGSPGDYLVIKDNFIHIVESRLFYMTFKPIEDQSEEQLQKIREKQEFQEYSQKVIESYKEFLKEEEKDLEAAATISYRHPYEVLDQEITEKEGENNVEGDK